MLYGIRIVLWSIDVRDVICPHKLNVHQGSSVETLIWKKDKIDDLVISEGYFYSRYKQSKNIHVIFPPRDCFRFFHLKRFIATDLKGTSKITIDDFIIFVWRLAVMLLISSRGM